VKILICYFSGTGNTKKIALLYGSALEANGAKIDYMTLPLSTEKIAETDFSVYDKIGIGYPIHAFNAPAPVLKFCKSLPKSQTPKDVFVFKTSGEPVRMSDVSSIKTARILKRRNYILTNEYQYVMPYNIIFRHSDAMAYRMWDTAQKVAPIDCKEILSGKPNKPAPVFLGGIIAWILRIEHWGAKFNGKHYKTREDCTKCGKCVKDCPAGNIKLEDGKIKFGKDCLMCMRCAFACPKDAIKIGLFDSWRVNGTYSFQKPEPNEALLNDKHAKYCEKAYRRYFEKAEKKINSSQK